MGVALVVGLVAVILGACQTSQFADQCNDSFALATAHFNKYADQYEPYQVAVISIIIYILITKTYCFLFGDERPWFVRAKQFVFRSARKIPFVRKKIEGEVENALVGIEHDLLKHNSEWKPNQSLPEKGLDDDKISEKLKMLVEMGTPDKRHAEGKVSGTIYVGGDDFQKYTDLLVKAYRLFAWTNPLHSNVFPGAEIVRMSCSLFGGGDETCGCHTSGGTESILLALRAYKEFYKNKKNITNPNVVVPRTAHPAFDKGCDYFGISLRRVPEDQTTRKADVHAMARCIDSNTIALVGSCPQYPHGAVDPIEDLARLALKHDIGLHVDCCLGSFVVPFMRAAGFGDFPAFDFSVEGVTSISADTHKFGCAPKGSSVVLYSNKELRRAQYSVFPDWPGGVYGTPTIAGSRPGALIAATWTALMYHGYEGYLSNTKKIMANVTTIANGIKGIDGLKLVCEPEGPIVAWTSDIFDVNRMLDGLVHGCGWDLNVLQFPPSVHLCVTMAHSAPGMAERFLKDIASVTAELMKNPNEKPTGAAALYGVSQSIPDRTIIDDIVRGFVDTIFQVVPERGHRHGSDD
eukprot:gene5388-7135_t